MLSSHKHTCSHVSREGEKARYGGESERESVPAYLGVSTRSLEALPFHSHVYKMVLWPAA